MAEKPHPCIHNTPALKLQLLEDLHKVVYRPSIQKFDKQLEQIQVKNAARQGYSVYGFTYRGAWYGPTFDKVKPKDLYDIHRQRLDPTLQPAMDLLLATQAEYQAEATMVKTTLTSVLGASQSVDDYRQLLPSMLHPVLDSVAMQCSCAVPRLPSSKLDAVREKHSRYIDLITQRQTIYLIDPP